MLRPLPRIPLLILALAILVSACGSDSNDSSDDAATATDETTTSTSAPDPGEGTVAVDEVDSASTTTSSSTTVPDGPTTTGAGGAGQAGVLADGRLTTDEGVSSQWSLTATTTSLCFEADLSHPDATIADALGDGVSACIDPAGGLDQLDGGLSVDVGTVDGEKTIGYLWGRVAPGVISLTIEHTNGTQTPIEILDGPTEVGLFVYVVEVASIPIVQDLDAVSGTQIEGSEPIRGFLRSGPTYPVVTPPSPTTSPAYPVS